LPLRDYAIVGDGRTAALVGLDGSIDWLCLPNLDSPSVFGAALDAEQGGAFSLAPEAQFESEHHYEPDSNVLQRTFRTAHGAVRVTDAMSLPGSGLTPGRELVRSVEGLAGRVAMRWRVEPRFDYGYRPATIGTRWGVPVATDGRLALAISSWEAGQPRCQDGAISGRFEIEPGQDALVVLAVAYEEPLVIPARRDVEQRLQQTRSFWRAWARDRRHEGPWRDAVLRSALALKLLVHAPSGAIAAAATASLPEDIGGERNWDYRFCWVRDAAFTLGALFDLGCPHEADAFFWWLVHASQLTHPRLQVLYRLDGGVDAAEKILPLSGYRGSRPVRIGNEAIDQLQLDTYGDYVQTAWLYQRAGGRIDVDTGRRLAQTADLLCAIWGELDSGIWEVRSAPAHFTHSKMMCWVALDRAARLAQEGHIPNKRARQWQAAAAQIRDFIERRCWSERLGSYTRVAHGEELDAGLLLAAVMGYDGGCDSRLASTIQTVRRELGHGPLLSRYHGEDGLQGQEGAFVCCSFWLAEALARVGRVEEAAELMDELTGMANAVGLYAEEIDPTSGEFLGNLPQGLVHLALIKAATAISEAQR
jgi:GH15 family glucan-1,4-alpha-glucosidase